MKILVVGKGGREHALVRAFAESPTETELFCFPGSDAIFEMAGKVEAEDLPTLIDWMKKAGVDLCVAGEESFLVKDEGLANACEAAGIPCWGPHKQSAQLEASKEFAKQFMDRHRIPTAEAIAVDSLADARHAIGGKYPVVLKFDGLAAGKGVAVCFDQESAEAFLKEVFTEQRFGPGRVLVEEFLSGPEVSIFAAVVDDQYLVFVPARDYKRIGEGDLGPNTGGMGAVASRQLISNELLTQIEREIIEPTVAGLRRDGLPYRGFLYFGLMITEDGPKVIEYNCRFGDPECQAVMPLVKGDLAEFCAAGAAGKLRRDVIAFEQGWSVCVVLASAGYPESSRNGDVITGIENAPLVYHAGTSRGDDNDWQTNGGRVLAVVATGGTLKHAVAKVYKEAEGVDFSDSQRRSDIGTLHF